MSLLIVNEGHSAQHMLYAPVQQTFTRETMGIRYFMAMVQHLPAPKGRSSSPCVSTIESPKP